MKILFFISVYGHGRGGHFHSLNHISRKIGENSDVKIISFGPGKSNIIESNPHFLEHIYFNGINFIYFKNKIKELIRNFNPEIYHCFDYGSYNTIRLLISSEKNKIIINKCGGPNPIKYPHVPNLILFSNENLNWFKNQKKHKNSNIYLIPNLVKSLLPDKNFQPIAKKNDEFTFLRICRIGSAYNKSINDSIFLIETLLSKGIKKVKLYIVGVIEDLNIFTKYNNHPLVKNGHVIFLTDPIYTTEASKMLYLADAVIGTGRGLMEASSLSIPLLAINKEDNIPVLLNNDNFLDAFKTNFSERNIFNDISSGNNIKNIITMIQKKDYYTEMSSFSKESFEKYFNIDKVVQSYSCAYTESVFYKRNILTDIYIISRTFIKFFNSNLNYKKQ